MSTEIPNLWPDNLASSEEKSPLAILKIQAALLGEKTKGIVEGRVTKFRYEEDDDPSQLHYSFSVIGPALGQYRADLFALHTSLKSLYPIKINVYEEPASDAANTTVKNEEELHAALRRIFRTERTRNIINAIRAHSFGVGAKEQPDEVPF